jgi:serine protease Do
MKRNHKNIATLAAVAALALSTCAWARGKAKVVPAVWQIEASTAAPQELSDPEQAQPPQQPKTPRAPKARAYSYSVLGSGDNRSYLGVDIEDITKERVSALKLKEERGVEITMVDQDAPAGKAGLKEHDVILDFNGSRVEGGEQLRRLIRETPPGREIALGISRDGAPQTIKVTLGDRGKEMKTWTMTAPMAPAITIPPIEMPDIEVPAFDVVVRSYSRTTGMLVDNLTPQLGEFFGVKGGEGVMVRSVDKGGAAEAAGLRAGDVIVKVGDERISDRNDWRRVLRNKSGNVSIVYVRDKKELNGTLNVASRRKTKDSGALWAPDAFDEDTDFDWDMDTEELRDMVDLQGAMRGKIELLRSRTPLAMELSHEGLTKALRGMTAGQDARQRAQRELQRSMELMRAHGMI